MAAGMNNRTAKQCTSRGTGPGGLYMELPDPEEGRAPGKCPVHVTSLSAGGVVLRVEDASGKFVLQNLMGREVVICSPEALEEDLSRIRARVLWTRPEEAYGLSLGLELADPDLRVRKILEDRLQGYPRDIKELWDQWDRIHAQRLVPSINQAVYIVGLGAMAGGTVLYFLGPESLRLFGSILAVYGCLLMAAKSAWAMWRERVVPEK